MPPQGRPTSSHSSRPMSSHSPRPSSGSHGGFHHSPPPHHGGFHHSPPPPHHHGGFHHSPPPHHYGPHRPYHSGGYRGPDDYRYGGNSCIGGCITTFAFIALIVFIVLVARYFLKHPEEKPGGQQSGYSQSIEAHDDIYVAPLQRDVSWSKKYNCYYDKETDCYFFLNTQMNPEIWQYWYEGTSSNYGDYGWMEWDARESKWYVQTGKKKWEILPEDQIQPHFWHFD